MVKGYYEPHAVCGFPLTATSQAPNEPEKAGKEIPTQLTISK